MVNTTTAQQVLTNPETTGPTSFTIPSGTFSFIGTNVLFQVPGVFSVGGTLAATRQPNGTVEIAIAGATVSVTVNGTEIFELSGSAAFQISPTTGFKLQTFKVNGFSVFGEPGIDAPDNAAPVLFPTADLAGAFKPVGPGDETGLFGIVNGGKLTAADLIDRSQSGAGKQGIEVQFSDKNGAGLKELSITDPGAEFEVLVNGQVSTLIAVNGAATRVLGKINTFKYSFTVNGVIPTEAVVQIRFLPGTFSDQSGVGGAGVTNFGETEQFFLVPALDASPRPVAILASPGNGEAITALDLNARRYIDITFQSFSDYAIDKTSITDSLPEFRLTGSGVADLAVDPLTGAPILVGAPLLISGITKAGEPEAKVVTYRFFFKDKDKTNNVDLFKPGTITVEFFRDDVNGRYFKTLEPETGPTYGARNAAGLSQSFTLDASAPGAVSGSKPIEIGPLSIQNPTIGIADIGFADGMLVLTIAIGADRAGLDMGKPKPTGPGAPAGPTGQSSQQASSGVTVDLLGILGTFDLKVDVFGLLSGNVRIEPTGKFGIRVSSLEAIVPEVVTVYAEGIEIKYDPAGDRTQELVKINSATVFFPKLNVRGVIKPYDPTIGRSVDDTGQTSGVIPGLVVRQNGFTIGTAELGFGIDSPDAQPLQQGPRPAAGSPAAAPAATQSKIKFGNILEFDDIRIGVQNFSVNLDAEKPIVFDGIIFFASGGVKLFPGKQFSATITDRNAADDVNPDGTPNDEALRIGLTFENGKVKSFQSTSTPSSSSSARRHAHRPTSYSTRAPPTTRSSSRSRRRREGDDRFARDRRRGAQLRLPRRRHVRHQARLRCLPERRLRPPGTASSGPPGCRSGSPRSASRGANIQSRSDRLPLILSASVTGIQGLGARSSSRARSTGS